MKIRITVSETSDFRSRIWILRPRRAPHSRIQRAFCRERILFLMMKITLAHISPRAAARDGYEKLVHEYLERASAFVPTVSEGFRSEAILLERLERQRGRSPAVVVLLDSRGRQMTSEAFALWLGARRDEGVQQMIFAVGPADGWSDAARSRAQLVLSLGPMTMAHSLARLVMAEQIYRALTILAGHPYHSGH